MDAAHQISTAAECGDIDAGIAVGVEDMFAVPMGGFAPDFHPELAEQEFYIGMGETAENLANDLDISREDQEEFAMNSHRKALKAYEEGKSDINIVMSLTTPGCGMGQVMADDIRQKLENLDEVNQAFVEITFDPPWSPEKMTDEGKSKLGFDPKPSEEEEQTNWE